MVFFNNPLSGLLILLALFIQSPWIGLISLVAVVSSTVTAIALKLDRDTIRSGTYGYNGILIGTALVPLRQLDCIFSNFGLSKIYKEVIRRLKNTRSKLIFRKFTLNCANSRQAIEDTSS